MKRREAHLTYRPPSKKASFAWLLVCTVGAALFAVMIAAQGALAHANANHDPNDGWFQRCALAKTGTFDPIVFPNNPGPVGHEHLFFGATAISHDSTVSSLLSRWHHLPLHGWHHRRQQQQLLGTRPAAA